MSTFPRASQAQVKGESGTNSVAASTLKEFGWLFRRTHNESDFGIDGHIDIVSGVGDVTGQQFAVQIKFGKSYFKSQTPKGRLFHGDLKHLNYYHNYPTRVLLLLVDPDTSTIYWAAFNKEDVVLTANGWSILVPFTNTFQREKQNVLLSLLPEPTDITPELNEFWKAQKIAQDGGLVILTVVRSDLEEMSFLDIEAFIRKTFHSKKACKSFEGKVEIVFDGFDDDLRELYEIDTCRAYVTSLFEANPELGYFLSKRNPIGLLAVLPLFFGFVRRETIGVDSHGKIFSEVTKDCIPQCLEVLFNGVNIVSNWLNLSQKQNNRISQEIIGSLNLPSELRKILSHGKNYSS